MEVTVADRRREKREAEAEVIREANLQAIRKRHIEGALYVTPLPKRSRRPNEDAAVLIPDNEAEDNVEPVNVACPWKVMPFVNTIIVGA